MTSKCRDIVGANFQVQGHSENPPQKVKCSDIVEANFQVQGHCENPPKNQIS